MPRSMRSVLIPVLAVAVVGLAVFFFLSDNRESSKKAQPGAGLSAEEGTSPVDPRPKRTVNLLFLSDEGDALVLEEREIVADPSSPAFEARPILQELINGSRSGLLSSIPSETRLIQVYVTRDGIAY